MRLITLDDLLYIILVTVTSIVATLTFLAQSSHGQERIFGQDFLAAQSPNFDEKSSLPYIATGSALGSLDHTFGDSLTPIHDLLSSGKFSYFRVHLINSSCIASSNCGPYEIGYGYTLATFESAVLKKDDKILNFLTTRSSLYCPFNTPNTKLLISPVLEHRLGTAAFRIVADAALKGCPTAQLVNNSVKGYGERYKGAWGESHATRVKGADIYSWDGVDATDGDMDAWIKATTKAKIAFVWSRGFNCRAGGGKFIDPRKRTTCPTKQYFELTAHITDDRGPAPTPSFKATFKPFKAPSIWKPLAENYQGVSDPRALLPVAILPFAAKQNINIRGVKGSTIGQLAYWGAYQGNFNRYYSGTGIKLGGYSIEKALQDKDKSPYAWLCQSGVCYGPIIGGRRGGLKR